MTQLGHKHIDVLKMDIEGAEYDVIENILSAQLPITQILIEFRKFLSKKQSAPCRQEVGTGRFCMLLLSKLQVHLNVHILANTRSGGIKINVVVEAVNHRLGL